MYLNTKNIPSALGEGITLRLRFFRAVVLSWLFLSLVPVLAQASSPSTGTVSTGAIQGILYDASGKTPAGIRAQGTVSTNGTPVPLAVVAAYDYLSGRLIKRVVLNSGTNAGAAAYFIDGLVPGKYLVVAGGPGYAPASHPAEVGADEITGQDLYLAPLAEPLANLVVMAFEDSRRLNGEWDPVTEGGVMGAVITLKDKEGRPVLGPDGQPLTGSTGPDGRRTFVGLAPGTYYVSATPPPGWIQTIGGLEGGREELITLYPGDPGTGGPYNAPAVLFGFVPQQTAQPDPAGGQVAGAVSSFDAGQPVPLAWVGLEAEPLRAYPYVVATVQADVNGRFQFPSVPAGEYRVVAWSPALDLAVTWQQVKVSAGGTSVVGIKTMRLLTSIAGHVVNGVDSSPMAGVVVAAKDRNGATLYRAVTDASGAYAFSDLPERTVLDGGAMKLDYHLVEVAPPSGYTIAGPVSRAILALAGRGYQADFALRPLSPGTGDIGGAVFFDTPATDYEDPTYSYGSLYRTDGRRQGLEPGIPGVAVAVYRPSVDLSIDASLFAKLKIQKNGAKVVLVLDGQVLAELELVRSQETSRFADPLPGRAPWTDGVYGGTSSGAFLFQGLPQGQYVLAAANPDPDYVPTTPLVSLVTVSGNGSGGGAMADLGLTRDTGGNVGETGYAPYPGRLHVAVFDDFLPPRAEAGVEPGFWQLAPVPYAPVAVRDHYGRTLDMVYTDDRGFVDIPAAPGVWLATANDAGHPAGPSAHQPDFNALTVAYEVSPGTITPADFALFRLVPSPLHDPGVPLYPDPSPPPGQPDIVVTPPGAGDGIHSIQEAIQVAVPGQTILVKPGFYYENIVIDRPVHLRGSGAATTAIDGRFGASGERGYAQGKPAVTVGVNVYGVTIDGFTIVNGRAVQGGGIYVAPLAHDVAITHNVLAHNAAGEGGGGIILRTGATDVRIAGNVIVSNGAWGGYGGGLHLEGSTLRVEIADNIFSRNFSEGYGGAIFAGIVEWDTGEGPASPGAGDTPNSDITITRNRITGNYAYDHGGGIALEKESRNVTISYNWIMDNESGDDGGGISVEDLVYGRLDVFGNVIARNTALDHGGGLSLDDSFAVRIVNNTIAHNQAKGFREDGTVGSPRGGGVDSEVNAAPYPEGHSNPFLANNILWQNGPDDLYAEVGVLSARYSLTTSPYSGTGNVAGDPLFVDPAGGDYHLRPGSPAVDAGENASATGTSDIDGAPRPRGAAVDMGADETSPGP